MKVCENCQHENLDEALFCEACGAELIEGEPVVEEVILELEKEPEPEPQKNIPRIQWYFVENNESKGPFEVEQMVDYFKDGRINEKTYVWKAGFQDWKPLEETELIEIMPKPEVNNDIEWYYAENGKTMGPVSESTMISLIKQGVIAGDSYVWNENFKDWLFLKDTNLKSFLIPGRETKSVPVLNVQQTAPVQQQTTSAPALQTRSVILYIVLSIFTCGIFLLIWLYLEGESVNRLCKKYSKPTIPDGIMAVILSIVTCGVFYVYYMFKCASTITAIRYPGQNRSAETILITVLAFFSPLIAQAILQDQINGLITDGVDEEKAK